MKTVAVTCSPRNKARGLPRSSAVSYLDSEMITQQIGIYLANHGSNFQFKTRLGWIFRVYHARDVPEGMGNVSNTPQCQTTSASLVVT